MSGTRILKRPYVALIGDMVGSRLLAPKQRRLVQLSFSKLMRRLNATYRAELSSKFVITLGDEFQAIISNPRIAADVIWDVSVEYEYPVRLGFGYGLLTTRVPPYAINVDGPALHHARASIELARKSKTLGGVFLGFEPFLEGILNGFARLLQFHRETRSLKQIKILKMLRQGNAQVEIAKQLKLTKQSVSRHVQAAGW